MQLKLKLEWSIAKFFVPVYLCLVNLGNCPGKLVLAGHCDCTIDNPYHKLALPLLRII